jgi:predicted GIY-YIG superfamily endonuclease
MKPGKRSHYDVYILIDPRNGGAFYVGCTSRYPERLDQHLLRRCATTAQRIADIQEEGLRVIPTIAFPSVNKDFAVQQERRLIRELGPFLLNIAHNSSEAA